MNLFFDLKSKKVGYSRIGKVYLSSKVRKYFSTPNIVIPMTNTLIGNINFLEYFENHEIFLITKEIFLKIGFLQDKFRNTSFMYSHNGTLERYEEILHINEQIFSQDNICSIIPFNIPTSSIDKDFAEKEIKNYIQNINQILERYPNNNFGITIKIFDYSELIRLYFPLITKYKNIRILNFADLFDTFKNYRAILKVINEVKQELNNNLVLMASGRIIPKFYPFLIYLGIDLIDSSYMMYISAENYYDAIEDLLPIYKLKELPCPCVACSGRLNELLQEKYSQQKIMLLVLHNLISAKNYMNKIKQYLNTEDYRAFLEKTTHDDPLLYSSLKTLDKEYFKTLRLETPLSMESTLIKCIGPISYNRPDFKEFRKRITTTFTPEPWTKLIIILPCSAKKPYSESKSHKLFYKVIRKFPEFPDFQEIILTSPLGAIPRQLENIYPVNSYDIPVTGEWDYEEVQISAKMLIKLLKKYNEKIPIICHLKDGGYSSIIDVAVKELKHQFYFSKTDNDLTSSYSLKSLEETLITVKDQFIPEGDSITNTSLTNTWLRKLIKIADYQYGVDSGIKLFTEGITTRKNRTGTKFEIFKANSNDFMGIFDFRKGQIELSLNGANLLFPFDDNGNTIIFDGDTITGSNLFRPGIIDYSSNIKPNSNVFILDKSKQHIIAIGNSVIGSNDIRNTKKGLVAEIYEKL